MAKKRDIGHEETEKVLSEIEKQISREYAQAEKEIAEKLDDYLRRFEIKDKIKRQAWLDGKITRAEYEHWRLGQIAIGQRWEEMKTSLAQDYTNAAGIAKSITDGHMPEVYAINHNYGTFQVEKLAHVDTSYTLYDRQSVERLFRGEGKLYHDYGIKTGIAIAEGKQMAWDRKQIQSVMTQALLQGESIGKIATRLSYTVGDSDRKACIRNARTMTTGVQNAGRVDSYKRAQGMGIKLEQKWLAVLDGRTRHEHRLLDGQRVKVGEKFKVAGYELAFPADPEGEAFLVYNCRCTLVPALEGFGRDDSWKKDMDIEGMTYDEWKESKVSRSDPITKQDDIAEVMKRSYNNEYRRLSTGSEGSIYYKPHEVHYNNPISGDVPQKAKAKNLNNVIIKMAEEDDIAFNPVKELKEKLSTEKIIERLAGGDATIGGSCASVAYAYAGNKLGYDVLDFRGGISRSLFAQKSTGKQIAEMDGVSGIVLMHSNDFKAANELLKSVIEGKEYILRTGRHCAVVRKVGNEYQYLELQSPEEGGNGYKPLNDSILKDRFGCRRSNGTLGRASSKKAEVINSLIDIDNLGNNEDFVDILGYINTNAESQQKGSHGKIQ